MDVPLSHLDLLQLAQAHPQLSPHDYARLHRSHPMHPEALLINDDYFLLFLQRRESDDACVFLGEEGDCTNYPARPRACRSFPFELDHRGLLRVIADTEVYPDFCDQDPVSKADIQEAKQHLAVADQEFERFHTVADRWNRRASRKPAEQTLEAFLAFLLTLEGLTV